MDDQLPWKNPIDCYNELIAALRRNPKDRALRIERNTLEGFMLGFVDLLQQVKQFKETENADKPGIAPSPEPTEPEQSDPA